MKQFIFGLLAGIVFIAIPATATTKAVVSYITRAEYDRKVANFEKRITDLEVKNVVDSLSNTDSVTLNKKTNDLNSRLVDLQSRFEDHQSCLRLWSIGTGQVMMKDDVYYCSNK